MTETDKEHKVPDLSFALIEWLEDIYPEVVCNPESDSDRKVWFKLGQRQVVQKIISEFKAQQDKDII